MLNFKLTAALLTAVFFISACGGGGGSTSPGASPVQPEQNKPQGEEPDGTVVPGFPSDPPSPADKPGPVPPVDKAESYPDTGGENDTVDKSAANIPDYDNRVIVGDGSVILTDKISSQYDKKTEANIQNAGYLTVRVKGTDVVILARSADGFAGVKDLSLIDDSAVINQFIDDSGKLVGYYGKASVVSKEAERRNGSGDELYHIYNAFYAMEKSMAKLPDINADYKGKFYYYYGSLPREATVSMNYSDKKIAGNIVGSNNNHHWEIDRSDNNVDDDGKFFVRLNSKSADKEIIGGSLQGGFYGKQGEFLSGHAQATDEAQWSGIIGAQKE